MLGNIVYVQTCNHHDLDSRKSKSSNSLSDAVLRWVFKRDKSRKAVVRGRVIHFVLRENIVDRVLVAWQKSLSTTNDTMTSGRHILDRSSNQIILDQIGCRTHIVCCLVILCEDIIDRENLPLLQVC